DAGLVAERLADRFAKHDRRVLDRVVHVDVRVTRRTHGEVGQRVLRERREHVVEERNRRVDAARPRAVEVDLEFDRGLARGAGAARGAGVGHIRILDAQASWTAARASRNAVVSLSVPAETRRWLATPTSRMRTP